MTIQQIKDSIAAGFNDAKSLLGFVSEALPVLEAVPAIGAAAPEINAALEAANAIVPKISELLASNDIDQPTHDALQTRVAAVVSGMAAAAQPGPGN